MQEKLEGRGMLLSMEPGLSDLLGMRPVVWHPGTFSSLPGKVSHPEVTSTSSYFSCGGKTEV